MGTVSSHPSTRSHSSSSSSSYELTSAIDDSDVGVIIPPSSKFIHCDNVVGLKFQEKTYSMRSLHEMTIQQLESLKLDLAINKVSPWDKLWSNDVNVLFIWTLYSLVCVILQDKRQEEKELATTSDTVEKKKME